jgi:hypothetical protein
VKFEEGLLRLTHQLHAQYGIPDGLVKIAVTPELFNRVIVELYSRATGQYSIGNKRYSASGRPHLWSELKIYGVQLVARERDDF